MEVLQEFFDYIFPGDSLVDLSFDTYKGNCTKDLEIFIDNMNIDMSRDWSVLRSNFNKLRPVLRTSIPFSRPNTQIETLLAMVKRNLNVPVIQGVVDEYLMVDSMIESHLSHHIFQFIIKSFFEI